MFKKVMVHTRRSIKFIVLFMISTFLIIGAIAFLYKPTYSVFINGEQVGYTENKAELQHKINNYIENGEEGKQNVAFVQVQNLPSYKLCLLKKNIVANDEEIFEKVKEEGHTYYRYYAILDGQEEKAYVSSFEEAEQIVKGLKDKNSSNLEKISIVEKYEQEIADLITSEEAISKLYIEPAKVVKVAKNGTTKYGKTGSVNTALTTSSGKACFLFPRLKVHRSTVICLSFAVCRLFRHFHRKQLNQARLVAHRFFKRGISQINLSYFTI